MKILIVEDETTLSNVLGDKFKKEGHQIEVEASGTKALETAKKFKPDLILLDLLLPGKGGLEILEELKDDEDTKSIPVVISSNLDDDENIKKALKLGAVDYYVKSQHPINEIVEKVEEIAKKAR